MQKESKKKLVAAAFPCGLLLLIMIFTGFLGMSSLIRGFKSQMSKYMSSFTFSHIGGTQFIVLGVALLALIILIVNIVFIIKKRKPAYLLHSFGLFLAMGFLPFLFLLVWHNSKHGNLTGTGSIFLLVLAFANVIDITWFGLLLLGLVKKEIAQTQHQVYDDGDDDVKLAPEAAPVEAGLSEEEVRAIVEEYMAKHIEEFHQAGQVVQPIEEPIEEPVEEEEPEEFEDDEDDEEEEEEEEVEVIDAQGQTIKIKRKKRVPFERKLRNSVYDIRHKYYDLRDYIKWYGLKNRISIPGDSFSLKRKKFAFITIVGKHIKFYIALDPDKYENSPIPVERATAKKYIDTPCVLRIKSDLSYRRAKQLVDDCMREAGIEKPEGEEPKETQDVNQ